MRRQKDQDSLFKENREQAIIQAIREVYARTLDDSILQTLARNQTTSQFVEQRVRQIIQETVNSQKEIVIEKLHKSCLLARAELAEERQLHAESKSLIAQMKATCAKLQKECAAGLAEKQSQVLREQQLKEALGRALRQVEMTRRDQQESERCRQEVVVRERSQQDQRKGVLQKLLQERQSKMLEAVLQTGRLKPENQFLRASLKERESELSALKRRAEEAEQESERRAAELRQLQRNARSFEGNSNKLEQTVRQLGAELQEAQQKRSRAERQVAELKEAFVLQQESTRNMIEQFKEGSRNKLQNYRRKVAELRERLKARTEAVQDMEIEQKAKDREVQLLEQKLESLVGEYEAKLGEAKGQRERDRAQYQRRADMQLQQLKYHYECIYEQRLRQVQQELQAQTVNNRQQLREVKAECEAKIRQLQSTATALRNQDAQEKGALVERLTAQLIQKETRLREAKLRAEFQQQLRTRYQKSAQKAACRLEQDQALIRDLRAKNAKLQEGNNELAKLLQGAQRQLNGEISKKVKMYQESIESLTKTNQTLQSQKGALRIKTDRQMAEKTRQLQLTKVQLEVSKAELQRERSKRETSEQQLRSVSEDLKRSRETLEGQVLLSKDKFNDERRRADDLFYKLQRSDSELSQACKRIQLLQGSLESRENGFQLHTEQLEQSLRRCESQLSSKEEETAILEQDLGRFRKKLNQVAGAVAKFKAAFRKNVMNELTQLKSLYVGLREDLSSYRKLFRADTALLLSQSLSFLRNYCEQQQMVHKQRQKAHQTMARQQALRLQQLSRTNAELVENCRSLQQQLLSVKNQLSKAKQNIQQNSRKFREKEGQLLSSVGTNKSLQQSVQRLTARLNQQVAASQSNEARRGQQLRQVEGERESIRKQLQAQLAAQQQGHKHRLAQIKEQGDILRRTFQSQIKKLGAELTLIKEQYNTHISQCGKRQSQKIRFLQQEKQQLEKQLEGFSNAIKRLSENQVVLSCNVSQLETELERAKREIENERAKGLVQERQAREYRRLLDEVTGSLRERERQKTALDRVVLKSFSNMKSENIRTARDLDRETKQLTQKVKQLKSLNARLGLQ